MKTIVDTTSSGLELERLHGMEQYKMRWKVPFRVSGSRFAYWFRIRNEGLETTMKTTIWYGIISELLLGSSCPLSC